MKNYKPKNVKVSDKYWKENLMKVLQVFEHEYLNWSSDQWHAYGISNADRKKIEQAYENYQRQNKKKESDEVGVLFDRWADCENPEQRS
jgi:hypothetical protein